MYYLVVVVVVVVIIIIIIINMKLLTNIFTKQRRMESNKTDLTTNVTGWLLCNGCTLK
jgi:uncharacterized membrane protein